LYYSNLFFTHFYVITKDTDFPAFDRLPLLFSKKTCLFQHFEEDKEEKEKKEKKEKKRRKRRKVKSKVLQKENEKMLVKRRRRRRKRKAYLSK